MLFIYLIPLGVLYRFCDNTGDARLIMPIYKNSIAHVLHQRPANGLMWFRDVNTKGIRGHVRPFRTEIYYMGVVKNRELKWSFVGALEITSKLPPAEYFLLATCRACPLAILAQTQGSGYWQLNHWNRLTSETSSLLDSTLLIHHN